MELRMTRPSHNLLVVLSGYDRPQFALPLRERIRASVAPLAIVHGPTIEHIARAHIRKEDVLADASKDYSYDERGKPGPVDKPQQRHEVPEQACTSTLITSASWLHTPT
jgi:hypothetical protein